MKQEGAGSPHLLGDHKFVLQICLLQERHLVPETHEQPGTSVQKHTNRGGLMCAGAEEVRRGNSVCNWRQSSLQEQSGSIKNRSVLVSLSGKR